MEKAKSYCNTYDYEDAIDVYNQVIKIDPKHKYAIYYKGQAYYYLSEY